MKLVVPPLPITDETGFDAAIDIFKRSDFGESLLNLIRNTDDGLVVALDSPWGEGKSTFVKMWKGCLLEASVPSIYFDAFENDYQHDPFLAITSQLYQLVDDEDTDALNGYKERAVSLLKIFGRTSLRIGVRAITAGVADENTILGDTDAAANDIAMATDQVLMEQLTKAKEDQACFNEFKTYLAELVDSLSDDDKPVIFIIDELDRCKPKFALALVECIKHFFSIPKLAFVLVMNRTQLEASVRKEYGTVDESTYLQKFISVWATLPKVENEPYSTTGIYVDYCLEKMEYLPASKQESAAIGFLKDLAIYFNLSLREIEKSLTNYAVIINATGANLPVPHLWLAVFLCTLKVYKPDLYREIRSHKIDYPELIAKGDLDGLSVKGWVNNVVDHPIKWLLMVYLADDDLAAKIVSKNNHFDLDLYEGNAIIFICKWLETFQID